ncbi:hypothetical protein BH20ACT21_BH20ACT21_11000 [soil metagenome]
MPGRNNAANVITAPVSPATTRVVPAPIATATGPQRAKDNGNRAVEMSQSRLDTRPRSAPGMCFCLRVIQAIVPAVSRAWKQTLAATSCHIVPATP